MELVRVVWVDSSAIFKTWEDIEEAKGRTLELIESVGWVVDRDELRVVLCADYGCPTPGQTPDVGRVFLIPCGCIREMVELGDIDAKAKHKAPGRGRIRAGGKGRARGKDAALRRGR